MESFPAPQRGRPKASEFVFARLRYDSGDWDYNPKVAANVLNSLVEYTTIPVYPEEVVITADSKELLSFPFLFMTGHKLVRFSREERDQLGLHGVLPPVVSTLSPSAASSPIRSAAPAPMMMPSMISAAADSASRPSFSVTATATRVRPTGASPTCVTCVSSSCHIQL